MNKELARKYLKEKIMSASKEDLLLFLFDGAISFAEQAKIKLDEKDHEKSHELLIKAQRIMMELVCSLQKDILPVKVYDSLVGLYNFVYTRLVYANLKKDKGLIDEALSILGHLRETFALAIKDIKQINTNPGQSSIDING